MKLVTLDFETAYSSKDKYSLRSMTTEEYINDPRFEVIGFSAQIGSDQPLWFSGSHKEIADRLGGHSWWKGVGLLCHNTLFDGGILAWKFGIVPAFYLDTLSMARPWHSANIGVSLHALAEHYKVGVKGHEVVLADGKWLKDFSPEELAQYGAYCRNDVTLTYKLFRIFEKMYPVTELKHIDRTIRMYAQPQLHLDREMIEREIENEVARKAELMRMFETIDQGEFRSNPKFAEVLRTLGVEPPVKRSAKKSEKAGHDVFDFAFAKSDADFMELLTHENPMVVAAVEARLGVKSTQRETRAARFAGICDRMDGKLPVPLSYYGAHTGRYAASESINLQNLQRVSRKDPNSGLLRKAIVAPPGKALVVCDLSQIEARLLVWQAGQVDKVEAFAQKRDVYSEQASVIYGRKVDRKKNPDDFTPGFIGKAVVLGCFPDKTMILSDSGWKRIIDITLEDRLWDGVEWVTHQGVVPQGEKEVVRAHGLEATSDHLVMTKDGWTTWGDVRKNHSLFQSALSLASLPSQVGTTLISKLPASTTTLGTSLATYGLSEEAKIQETEGASANPKKLSMTYDIAYAGPRNRFTVATTAGPIIVHNCGYGLGAPKFSGMIYVGMLGERGILFDESYVNAIGVDVGRFIDWIQRKPEIAENYMKNKPAAIGEVDWVTHCAVGTSIIRTFRTSNEKIVEYWATANNALGAMLDGVAFEFGGPSGRLLRTVFDNGAPGILLPNGMVQRYEGLERDKEGNYSFLRRKEGKIQRVKVYGGSLVENLTQGLARIVVMDAGLSAANRGYPMVLQVHDELVSIADESKGEEAYKVILECMRTPPAWGADLPLDAEGGFGYRYGDVK